MVSYFLDGFWYLVNGIVYGLVGFAVVELILFLTKKRSFRDIKTLLPNLCLELLLCVYLAAILKITGILGREYAPEFNPSDFLGLLQVPFVGASIKMVTLNFILFIPYGFLSFFVFRTKRLNAAKAFLIGLFTSLFIEVWQAFTGRLAEIDDLLTNAFGFLVGFLIAEAISKLRAKETRRRGVLQLVLTVLISAVCLFLLSFVANGDRMQAERDAYYNGLYNSETDIAAVSKMQLIRGGKEVAVADDGNISYWYSEIGLAVDNNAGQYVTEECDKAVSELTKQADGKIYVVIKFIAPQTFRFYNNPDWEMLDVGAVLYCMDDGRLWYGADADTLSAASHYENAEHPFITNDEIIGEMKALYE